VRVRFPPRVHDAGNVNFSFIKNIKSSAEISFNIFTAPVVDALAKLGIKATTSGRNDMLVEGLKISGNAEHIFKNRVLHHGTLLFNSDLQNLGQALKIIPGKYESKAVQSNRSPVANISSFLEKGMSVNEFIEFLLDVQVEKNGVKRYELNETDIQNILKLSEEKFSTWEWNFGYSPKYTFKNEVEIDGKALSIRLVVEKGIIVEAEISGDYLIKNECQKIQNNLPGIKHFYNELSGLSELSEIGSAIF
jgi:lipoate---protein ligase